MQCDRNLVCKDNSKYECYFNWEKGMYENVIKAIQLARIVNEMRDRYVVICNYFSSDILICKKLYVWYWYNGRMTWL